MFESYCEKAKLRDGLAIMDLGCGKLIFCITHTFIPNIVSRLGKLEFVSGQRTFQIHFASFHSSL